MHVYIYRKKNEWLDKYHVLQSITPPSIDPNKMIWLYGLVMREGNASLQLGNYGKRFMFMRKEFSGVN